MSEDAVRQFKLDKDRQNEALDCKRCDEWKEGLFKYSPIIRFMRQNINQLHGDINESNICANELRNKGHLEDTLAHEMVHAYDHLRFNVDWMADLRHAACAEIRASSLSGECRWTREFFTRGQWAFTQHHQDCVRRRAVASVMHRPFCKDQVQAIKVVNEVWDSCFADTRPFDEIYR
ncbi:MAG: Mitochondrial inner membrane protease atp23 [Thelocarpon superellum]|nr:MAG: Mitochondrial inner membrane protease atp23 [Thelocarpon superellum]